MDLGSVTSDDGAILGDHSDGGETPGLPSGALALRPHSGCFESSLDSDAYPSGLPGHTGACLDSCAPESAGGNPDAPPSQRQQTDPQKAQDEEEEAFRERRNFPYMAAPASSAPVIGRDMQHATRSPWRTGPLTRPFPRWAGPLTLLSTPSLPSTSSTCPHSRVLFVVIPTIHPRRLSKVGAQYKCPRGTFGS